MRAFFAQDLLRGVLALAAVGPDAEMLAQLVETAAQPGAMANLAVGHRIADADIHMTGGIAIIQTRMIIAIYG